MAEPSLEQFKAAVLPHLDAAYNLARWLTRREHDAQDIVQDAYLRAWKSFGEFHGGDSRRLLIELPPWLPDDGAQDDWQSSPWDTLPPI